MRQFNDPQKSGRKKEECSGERSSKSYKNYGHTSQEEVIRQEAGNNTPRTTNEQISSWTIAGVCEDSGLSIDDLSDESKFYSGKISDIIRQLALGGFALVWLFKYSDPVNPGKVVFPSALLVPTYGFSLAVFFDLLQYIVEFTRNELAAARLEKTGTTHRVTLRIWPRRISMTLWVLKFLTTLTAYLFLFRTIPQLIKNESQSATSSTKLNNKPPLKEQPNAKR